MKNIFKSIITIAAAVSLFAGCAKEEAYVDPYSQNWVYIQEPSATSFTVTFKPDGIWMRKFNEVDDFKTIRCTKPAVKDVNVNLAIDETLIEKYNLENKTNYKLLPIAKLQNETLVIKQGKYVSEESIQVVYENVESIIPEGSQNYLVPVVIKSADASLTISEQSVIYLTYTAEEVAGAVKVNPAGTSIDKTGWTIKDANGNDYTDRYAVGTSGIDFSKGSAIIVDFGKTINLKSVGMVYSSETYSAKNVTVLLSTDGTDFKSIGSYDLVRKGNHNIELYNARQVSAVKIVLNSSQGTKITIKDIVATIE